MTRRRRLVWATAILSLVAGCASPTTSEAPSATGVVPTASPALAAPTPTPVPEPATASLKLMDFNIEYGGETIDFAKIVEAVKLADPDVVALEEASGNTRKLAEALGWPYASVRSQLISKLPLIDPPGADGLYAYVEVRPGQVVAVSNVHLPSDPYGPTELIAGSSVDDILALEAATRLPAIQERLDVLPDLVAQGIPTFLTGDFNAPSHLDWTDEAVGQRPHVTAAIAWPVSTAIAAAGFRDTYRELHPDPVADPGLTWWAGRPLVDGYPDPSEPQDRIDIIYAAGPVTTDATAIVGEAGGPQVDIAVDPWGTDHRGVLGTFTVTPAAPAPYVAVDQRLATLGEPVIVRYQPTAATASVVVRAVGSTGEVVAETTAAPAGGPWEVDPAGLKAGDHEVWLVTADGSVESIAEFSVVAAGTPVTLATDAATYASGDPVTVVWRDAPGARWDWIGIYPRGGDPLVDSYLYYVYTDQSVAGSVVIDESGEGDWPIPPGDYDAHYLLDDGYVSLASTPFTVTK